MALTEKLLVKLQSDVSDYISDMKKVDQANKDTGKSGAEVSGSLSKVGNVASVAAGALVGLAAGAVALGAALSAMALNSAGNRRELERFARQAKTSTEEFQALAFAAGQYGIEADSVADLTKDISDRLGEFATAGTGAFQDFADVMGFTASEARDTAAAMQEMSGEEALRFMVSEMENAGATTNDMTFALESMGGEMSRLIPLFVSQGAELDRVTEKYNKFAGAINISEGEAKDLAELKENFDLLQSSFSNAATAISATLAPTLNSFINSVLEVVPDATETIIDFVNAFRNAEDIQNIGSIQREIASIDETIANLRERMESSFGRMNRAQSQQLENEIARKNELQAQLELLEKQNEAEAKRREGGTIAGVAGDSGGVDENGKTITAEQAEEKAMREQEARDAQLEALRQFSLTREEILLEQYQREAEMLNEYQQLVGASDEDLYARRIEMGKRFRDQMVALKKSEASEEEDKQKSIKFSMEDGVRVAALAGQALFEDNKAVKAGLIVADTAAAIMKSLSINPYDYGNVAILALTGALQLTNALSSSKGGGATSSGAAGTSITNTPDDFETETTNLDIRAVSDGEGSTTQRVSISVDDSEEFLDALAQAMQTRVRSN